MQALSGDILELMTETQKAKNLVSLYLLLSCCWRDLSVSKVWGKSDTHNKTQKNWRLWQMPSIFLVSKSLWEFGTSSKIKTRLCGITI